MDRKKKSKAQVQILRFSNPELVPIGLPSPEKGVFPCSVSPIPGSLQEFVENEGDIPPESLSVKLSEYMGKSKKHRGRRKKTGKKKVENTVVRSESSRELQEINEEHQEESEEPQEESIFKQDLQEAADEVAETLVELQIENKSQDQDIQKDREPASSFENFEDRLLNILKEQLQSSKVEADNNAQNKQEQDYEILALEAIYENKFKFLNADGELPQIFMITVPIEIPESIEVLMDLSTPSSSGDTRKPGSYSFALEHLPPVYLACTYTSGYPTREAPHFVLYSRWMNTEQLMGLSKQLDIIWSNQVGEVVLFAWVEFLHSQTLSTIGATNNLVLKPLNQTGNTNTSSSRVLSHFTTPETEALNLLRYNEKTQLESFNQSFHLCDICFTEYAGTSFIKLPCEHFYCRECMGQYAKVYIEEGSVNRLKCPDNTCGGSFPPHLLKELVDAETFQRWENLLLQKTLDSMTDVTYCPRCDVACIEDPDNLAQCGACYYNFCSLCKQPSHVGQQCLTPEGRLRVLQERSKGKSVAAEQMQIERNLVNEILNLTTVRRDSIQCPSCGHAISKTEGCNKMVCHCGTKFCFVCGKVVQGYGHFGDGSCVLFSRDDIEAWEAQMNGRVRFAQAQAQARAQLHPENLKPCPACRQLNAKVENNNHIYCWACQNHYCALCNKVVRRGSEHYGPRKCRQHTAD